MRTDHSCRYDTYTRGTKADVFLKNPDGSTYIGAVWPGYTVFADWHSPKAGDFWANELVTWHDKVAFDGIVFTIKFIGKSSSLSGTSFLFSGNERT